MRLELRPTRKSVATRDLELRIGDRLRRAGLEQILGLILQMAEIGAFGKRAVRFWWNRSAWRPPFIASARCPHIGLKEGSAKLVLQKVGFYPFRGPDASSTLTCILAEGARPEK